MSKLRDTRRLSDRSAAYCERGIVKARLGQLQEAVEDYGEAIRLAVDQHDVRSVAHYNRGLAKAALGLHQAAVEDYDEAIRLAPEDRKEQYRSWRDLSKNAPLDTRRRFAEKEKRVPDQSILDDVVQRIVAVAKPERVILFGSAARGDMGPDSDLDLLIVRDGDNDSQLLNRIYGNLGGKISVDVVLVTPESLERYKDSHALIYKHALSEGRVVYESAS